MKKVVLLGLIAAVALPAFSQNITPGRSIEALRLGQTYEEVVEVLGFRGELKTYEEYVAEELFNMDPNSALECVLGFDYYVRYAHLLTLPVSCVFFKDGRLVQIMVSSIPEYYHALARKVETNQGLKFWTESGEVEKIYGKPAMQQKYPDYMLNTMFYLEEGIAMSIREDLYRSVHIFELPSTPLSGKFLSQVQ
jgi:hypothetical protein